MSALLVLYISEGGLLDNIPYSSLFWRLDIVVISWRGGVMGVDYYYLFM
jgi:hypothetical protein